jgi:hypothetical protein
MRMHVANSVTSVFANATHGVGIAAKIGECAHAKNPADYGSGPGEIVIVVGP